MEEDEETKRLNERRRIREERRKKQEEDEKKEELERKQREEERKQRKEQRNKERGEREEKQKKELEEYIKRSEDERKQRREERERRRVEEERLAKEEEEKRRKLLEERERKRREEDEEKKRKIKELEESRKRILKELEEEDNNSQVESILSLKKKRLAARQKIESILSSVNPTNNQYAKPGVTIEGAPENTTTKGDELIIGLLLNDELKEEVIDLVASGFRQLIDYLSQPPSIATMIEFLVDTQMGSKVFNAKQDLMNGTASIEIKNWLARMQASYEILKGGIPIIAKIITDPVNSSVLDILFGMISNPPPICLTNMHIFYDLVCSFMSRKPEMLVYICDNKDTILPSMMQHLSNSETVDLLLKMAEVEMTQFNENQPSTSSSTSSSFFSLFSSNKSSSTSSSSSASTVTNSNGEKPHWTSELTPYLILRINEICNLENVIMDQLDLEIDNICRLMSELIKKYPKSKVAHHLCGQSFSNAILRNGFKLVLSLPYTSPISSSMLTLMCTLIDSSITMTQLTSSSTSAPDHPSVINHLFKQIVVVDIAGTDETRELSPMKAIYEVLNIKDYSEPFNVVRLKCLHLINSMVKANIAKLDKEIWESGILKKSIDLFFEYETNNVIHCMVESFVTPLVQRCLGSDDEEFMCHLLKDCSFISRVVNILSGGYSGNSNNNNNNSNINQINNSSSIGSISSSSGSGVANRLTALFVNTKDEPEPPKSEPVIGAPAPAIGSLSRGGGKKIRRKVSFFGGEEEENNSSNGSNENSNNSDLKFAVGDLSTNTPNESNINVADNQNSSNNSSGGNSGVVENNSLEKKLSNGSISASISSSSSSSSSSLLKRSSDKKKEKEKEKEIKEMEKLKQKEKDKELLEMLKSQKLSSDQEKEIKAQRKQEKKERKQKREEKKLAKRLKEKERESKEKSKSKSTITLVSNTVNKEKRSSTSLSPTLVNNTLSTTSTSSTTTTTTSSSSSSSSSTSTITSTTTTNLSTISSTTTTTTIKNSIPDQSSDNSSDSASNNSDTNSVDVSKLSLNDLDSNSSSNNNDEQNIDIENIESIEEQSVVVVYHENDKDNSSNNSLNNSNSNINNSSNNSLINNESCNNSNSNNNNNNNNNINNIIVEKKKVNHNVGHIISLCIEITHIVNKSKNQLLRDIVDECCSFQGQWDEVVVPKLKQEISHRSVKPIGTVSMRKGRKGGPPTPFTNVEYFPNTANGVPIPPTETTSKFFF